MDFINKDAIQQLLALPHRVIFEGVIFKLELIHNGDKMLLCYPFTNADENSKHYQTVTYAGFWYNPLLKYLDDELPEDPATIIKGDGYPNFDNVVSDGYSCSFLYLCEGIQSVSDLSEAVEDTKYFLMKHNLLK